MGVYILYMVYTYYYCARIKTMQYVGCIYIHCAMIKTMRILLLFLLFANVYVSIGGTHDDMHAAGIYRKHLINII
jgi:hypothetical protein